MYMNESRLVRQAQSGDPNAYGDLVRAHQTAVLGVCWRILGNVHDAEDAAQEAFIRAYTRLHTFDAARPFGPWIRRVAANVCLNRVAVQAAPLVELNAETEGAWVAPSPEWETEQAEQAEAVRAAFLSLPPTYRVVVELRHFQDMSYADMASLLGLPVNTIKSHVFRARQLLATRLTSQD